MFVRQGAARAALLSTLATTVLTVFAATPASAATTPPYEPDSNAAGSLAFYDAMGNRVVSGSVDDNPFAAYAVGSTSLAGATSTKASLFGALPKSGQPTGSFSNEVMSGPTTFPITTAGAPAVAKSSNPTVNLLAGDVTLGQLAADFPNTATDSYAGLYQLRIKVAGATQYLATDIQITGSTWTQVYPAPPVAQTTTTTLGVSPTGSAVAGDTVTLSATVSPVASGTVQFLDSGMPIGMPVTVVMGQAQTTTTSLAVGSHSLTAAFTSADTSAFGSSTSTATTYSITAAPTAPGAPTGVTATPGDSSATVSWTAPGDGGSSITGYTVTTMPSSAGCTTTGATSCAISGLTNGTQYTVFVTATNGVGTGPASTGVTVTPATAPSAPTAVTTTPSYSSAGVSWTAPTSDGGSPVTSYTVTATPSTGATLTKTGVTGTSTTVTGLTNGRTYTVTVQAVNAAGTSAASAGATVTPAAVPAAPAKPTATAGNGQATVAFTAPDSNGSAITGYTVTASPGGATATGTASPLVVTGLTNGTAYTFTVTATNGLGDSAASPDSNAVTPKVPTTTVLNATPSATDAGAAFTLTGKVNGVAGAQTVVLRTSVAGSTTSTTISAPGGVFSIRVTPQVTTTYQVLYLGDATHAASSSVARRTTVRSRVSFSTTSVRLTRVTVTGVVAPGYSGEVVTLGEIRSGRFVALATVRTGTGGRFTAAVTLARGSHVLQLKVAATTRNAAGVSATRTVRV